MNKQTKPHLQQLFFATLFIGASTLHTAKPSQPPAVLEVIRDRGELKVVVPAGPTPHYAGSDESVGFEHDLASAFADYLGVDLKIVSSAHFNEVSPRRLQEQADLAAGLAVTPSRREGLQFGPAYQEVTSQLVYRDGRTRPASVKDLAGGKTVVAANSVHAERLIALQQQHPDLDWEESRESSSNKLLRQVAEGDIDYTVASSTQIMLNRRYYPELEVAFDLGEPQPVAWAFPETGDDSLYQAAQDFFQKIADNGTLEHLQSRYYGHLARMGNHGTLTFMQHVNQRLPRYLRLFKQAAERHELDWRLLAAMSYQESLWDPAAVSPTGVRGLMMLTLDTARQLGIEDRVDPRQSITGGAAYYNVVKSKIPKRIAEPDRTWMAMAAYNIGFGHLEDARVLTQRLGGDPDRWMDVMQHLPLLSMEKWHKQTEYGYARGSEPVGYVQNIRNYYDILVWLSKQEHQPEESEMAALETSLENSEEVAANN